MTRAHLDPTDASAVALFRRGIEGPVVMLNLLRLRDVADYREHPELDPGEPISGDEAFRRYIEHTTPFLEATGGSLQLLARGGPWFIGPEEERWDLAMLVEQASVDDFLAFAQNPAYLAGLGHRSAAITDSRLLPLEPLETSR